jgi:hypothetical protein
MVSQSEQIPSDADMDELESLLPYVAFLISSKEGLAFFSIEHGGTGQCLGLPVFPSNAIPEALPLLEPAFRNYAAQWERIMVDPFDTDTKGFWVPTSELPGDIADPAMQPLFAELWNRHAGKDLLDWFGETPSGLWFTDPSNLGGAYSKEYQVLQSREELGIEL